MANRFRWENKIYPIKWDNDEDGTSLPAYEI